MRKLIQRGALLGMFMLSTLSINGSFAGQATPDGCATECGVSCDARGRCQVQCQVKCKWI